MKINVKIKLTRGASMPSYATDGSAALDLRAALEGASVTIAPGATALLTTGLSISPGAGVVAVIASRSGLGIKHGITLANGIGVIDSDYRGEIQIGLRNASDKPFTVNDGDRIAQMMFLPVYAATLIQTDNLDDTTRGEGGFGSTGIK